MATSTDIDPEIERIASEVMDEYDQSEQFKNRFVTFYKNVIENNYDERTLERLINKVELPEEEEIDGS